MADAAKISGLGKNIFGYAEGGLDAWNILPWIWSFGGGVTDAKFTKATGYLNSAKSVAALQFLVDLKDKSYSRPPFSAVASPPATRSARTRPV